MFGSKVSIPLSPRAEHGEEGDGWLLGTVHNLRDSRTELVVIDAPSMTEVARVILPFHNAPQIHGAWVGRHELSGPIGAGCPMRE